MGSRLVIFLLGAGATIAAVGLDLGEPGFGAGQKMLAATGLGLVVFTALPVEWNRNLLLALAGLAVGIVVAEVGLQSFSRLRFSTIYEPDPEVLYRHIPGSAKSFKRAEVNGGQTITVRINSLGFRGEELVTPKRGRRIVVYGDSFVAAEFSALEDTFVKQIERRIGAVSGDPVEAVNGGVVGYGPDQIGLRLVRELPEIQPDLVVLAVCAANDHGDLVRNKLFSLDGSGQLLRHHPVLSEELAAGFRQASGDWLGYKLALKSWRLLRYGSRPPREGPELAEFQARRMEQWLTDRLREYRELERGTDGAVTDIFGDHYDADMSLAPESESARYKAELMERVLPWIQRTGAEQGVPVVFVFIPAGVDVCERREYARVDRARFPGYRRSTLTDGLEQIAERHSLRYLNLFGPFRQHDPDGLYFRGADSHWNDRGQAMAAELLTRYLTDTRLFRIETNRPPKETGPSDSRRPSAD